MEIDVTVIMEDHDLSDYSDSVYASGRSDIGKVTWENACQAIKDLETPLVTEAQQGNLREWLAGFGAWSRAEISAMSDTETQAILLQFVASDGQDYLAAMADDRVEDYLESDGGSLYLDADTGRWTYYVGI